MSEAARWLREAGWGVMCHYLAGIPGGGGDAFVIEAETWQAQVEAFDVPALVEQVAGTGARYLLFTVGQNSGHYCSPNPVYDELTGLRPSRCARRDLIAELGDALSARGLRLLVYTTGGAPEWPPAAAALGWVNNHRQPGHRLAEFQRRWNRILAEWSIRWGRRVSGWWIDGCYFAETMYAFADEPNWDSLRAALKAGNPEALVAFNPGVKVPIVSQGGEDYTAGEIAGALPVGRWHQGGFTTRHETVDGAQYHVLSFLGESWRLGEPRFADELAAAYTRFVIANGGAITWDVPITPEGIIPEPFVRQLTAIGVRP